MNANCNIGEKIKKLRVKKNMSQVRFGEKIGLSGKCISAYETGKCNPPLKILETISSTYNVPILPLNTEEKANIETKITLVKQHLSEIETLINESLSF
ncbi:hypothetical protein A3K42_01110 [candidate division WWE3 bacterium RBG_13_37_7]|uniref:HTH cro/C1-type domain-containing protein n=1 Tax=candidate division WWE3 bacterium RBG_13_37_7 TaxID=1802609 RepID=A0A1F4U0X4_UNCKA|nr:MAG: hypothetical protein A3K42_01110 [candidate division WWE3 bacterium RBG_13_37_7]